MKKIIVLITVFILLFLVGCQRQKEDNVEGNFSPKSIKAKVIEIFDEYSLAVEIVETKTDKFKVGDIVKAEFSDSNNRAIDIIEGLEVDDIIRLHYLDIDNNYEKDPKLIKCDGLDVYDSDGNEPVILYR